MSEVLLGDSAVETKRVECPHCKKFRFDADRKRLVRNQTLWSLISALLVVLGKFVLADLTADLSTRFVAGLMTTLGIAGLALASIGWVIAQFLEPDHIGVDTTGREHVHGKLFAGGFVGTFDESGEPIYFVNPVLRVYPPLQLRRRNAILSIHKTYLHPTDPTAPPTRNEHWHDISYKLVGFGANGSTFSIRDQAGTVVCASMTDLVTDWLGFGAGNFHALMSRRRIQRDNILASIASLENVFRRMKDMVGKSLYGKFCEEQCGKLQQVGFASRTETDIERDLDEFLEKLGRKRKPASAPHEEPGVPPADRYTGGPVNMT